jgi:hypothetical protein
MARTAASTCEDARSFVKIEAGRGVLLRAIVGFLHSTEAVPMQARRIQISARQCCLADGYNQ